MQNKGLTDKTNSDSHQVERKKSSGMVNDKKEKVDRPLKPAQQKGKVTFSCAGKSIS